MHKTILILEESKLVHDVFKSALPRENGTWNIKHESVPQKYVSGVRSTNPDIIFLSSNDQKNGYKVVTQIKSHPMTSKIPVILLTAAKDSIDETHLQSLGVATIIRKPFEFTTLQDQIETIVEDQRDLQKKNRQRELDRLNVIDDELLEILSDKSSENISMEDLEVELDPTTQLLSDDKLNDGMADDEADETELLELEPIESVDDDSESSDINLLSEGELDADSVEASKLKESEALFESMEQTQTFDETALKVVDLDETELLTDIEARIIHESDSISAPSEESEIQIIVDHTISPYTLQNTSDSGSFSVKEIHLVSGEEEFQDQISSPIQKENVFGTRKPYDASVADFDPLSKSDEGYAEIKVESIDGGAFEENTDVRADDKDAYQLSDIEAVEEIERVAAEEPALTSIENIEDEATTEEAFKEETYVSDFDEIEAADLLDDGIDPQVGIDIETQATSSKESTDDLSYSVGDQADTIEEIPLDSKGNIGVGFEAPKSDIEEPKSDLESLTDQEPGDAASNIQQVSNLRQVPKAKYELPRSDQDSASDYEKKDLEDGIFEDTPEIKSEAKLGLISSEDSDTDGGFEISLFEDENSDSTAKLSVEEPDALDFEDVMEADLPTLEGDIEIIKLNEEAGEEIGISEVDSVPRIEPELVEISKSIDDSSDEDVTNEAFDFDELIGSVDDTVLDEKSDSSGSVADETSEAELSESFSMDAMQIASDDTNDPFSGEISADDIPLIEQSDEAVIEVPTEVFEIGDFKMENVISEEEPLPADYESSEKGSQNESETEQSSDLKKKSIALKEKFLKNLSPAYKAELGHLIEGVISDTIQSTLHKVLPKVVDKIIQEEIKG